MPLTESGMAEVEQIWDSETIRSLVSLKNVHTGIPNSCQDTDVK